MCVMCAVSVCVCVCQILRENKPKERNVCVCDGKILAKQGIHKEIVLRDREQCAGLEVDRGRVRVSKCAR